MSAAGNTPWRLDPPYTRRSVLVLLVVGAVLWVSGSRVQVGRLFDLSGEAALQAVGLPEHSQVGDGLAKIRPTLFPIVLAERTPVARIEHFDERHLPPLSHIEHERTTEQRLNPNTLQMEATEDSRDVLVEPVGYLLHVLEKMLETVELGLWGTVF